jgi:hypothetical protein
MKPEFAPCEVLSAKPQTDAEKTRKGLQGQILASEQETQAKQQPRT